MLISSKINAEDLQNAPLFSDISEQSQEVLSNMERQSSEDLQSTVKNTSESIKQEEKAKENAYDPDWGKRLALSSRSVSTKYGKCSGKNLSRGDCYACTFRALVHALKKDPYPNSDTHSRLNPPPYSAKFFAMGWNEDIPLSQWFVRYCGKPHRLTAALQASFQGGGMN